MARKSRTKQRRKTGALSSRVTLELMTGFSSGVVSPNSDIKTEDGLSHSPGQTGLLGYSNFSSTPPSQSLYSYSHTHGQWHLCSFDHLFLLLLLVLLLLSPHLSLLSSPLPLRHTCSPLAAVWTPGVNRPPPPFTLPPLFSFFFLPLFTLSLPPRGQNPFFSTRAGDEAPWKKKPLMMNGRAKRRWGAGVGGGWNVCDCVFAADHIPQAAATAPHSTARPSAATFTAFESSVKLTLSRREGWGYTAGWAGLRLQWWADMLLLRRGQRRRKAAGLKMRHRQNVKCYRKPFVFLFSVHKRN